MSYAKVEEWYQCPHCYRELHHTELGIEFRTLKTRKPNPRRAPGPIRYERMAAAVQYLRRLDAPYFVRAQDLHDWLRKEFAISPEAARVVSSDLRLYGSPFVGFSGPEYGRFCRYWYGANTERVRPELLVGNGNA